MSLLGRNRILRWFRRASHIPIVGVCEHLSRHPPDGHVVAAGQLDGPPIYRVRNVLVHSSPSVFLVSSNGRRAALAESENYDQVGDALHDAFRRHRLGSPRHDPGEWMVLNDLWANNLWHWLFECLPKVVLAEAAGFTGHYLVPSGSRFIVESMMLLNIDPKRISIADGSSFYAASLWVTGRLPGGDLFRFPMLGDSLRQALLAASRAPASGSKRIYISRRKGRRALVNEAELETLIEAYGFQKVYMEDHTLEEQIGLMRSCRVLLAPHGAGMAHVLFMPPRSLVLELFSPAYVNPTMLGVVDRFQHRYFMIPSYWNSRERKRKPYVHGQDVEAYLDVIDITLKRELDGVEKPTPAAAELSA